MNLTTFRRRFPLQSLWHELREQLVDPQRSLATDVELRLTGLMTSPSLEVAQEKLGKYLQESQRLREANQPIEALVIILVGAEYYWRKHRRARAAGLLLEAADLFYLLDRREASQRCLTAIIHLVLEGRPTRWWEFEIMANTFLLMACLTLMENPSALSGQLRSLRVSIPKKLLNRLRREDGYRVANRLQRAARVRSLIPLNDLDTMPTQRSSSEFATLYEYLLSLADRYMLIQDGLTALRRLAQIEE